MDIIGTIRKYRKYEIMKVKDGWKILKLDIICNKVIEAMDKIDEYEDSRQ